MPAVTEPPSPNGLPIATTQSPTRALVESPNFTKGRLVPSILSTARSDWASLPISLALNSRLSGRVTVIDSTVAPRAPAEMTWLLVTT